MPITNFIQKNINSQMHSLRMPNAAGVIEQVEAHIPHSNGTDRFFRLVEENAKKIKEERLREFFSLIPEVNRQAVRTLVDIPGYFDPFMYPYYLKAKPEHLEYLSQLAGKKDKFGYYRIPAMDFSIFYEVPIEKLKQIENILLSKNDLGTWNYDADIIPQLMKLDKKKIEMMSKLLDCKVHRDCAIDSAYITDWNWEKVLEKAQTLNEIYGKDLREILFFENVKNEKYITAHIQLPHSEDKPDYFNFQEIFVKLDDDLNPKYIKKTSEQTEKLVNNIYDNLEKNLALFKEEDLSRIISTVSETFPELTQENILTVLQKLTQFANYSSIKHIGEVLKDNNVGKIFVGSDLSDTFNYLLTQKRLAQLSGEYKSKYGMFITKKDMNNPKFVEFLKQMSKREDFKQDVKLFNLEGWFDGVNLLSDDRKLEDSTLKTIRKIKKIMKKNSNLTFEQALDKFMNGQIEANLEELGLNCIRISSETPVSFENILGQMRPIMPKKSIMKSNIEMIANRHSHSQKSFAKLCDDIAEYYNDANNIFTKQNIIEALERFNNELDEYLAKNNLTRDNVYFIKPYVNFDRRKSFDIIAKMYQQMYDIPSDRIRDVKVAQHLNGYPKDSVFVILDDFSGTGHSMGNVAYYDLEGRAIEKDRHIIFAPIMITKEAQNYIQDLIKSSHRTNFDTIISVGKGSKNIIEEVESASRLSKKVLGHNGYGGASHYTIFPYMSADNNSELAGDLSVFFLPRYQCIENKSRKLETMKEDTYIYNVFGTNKKSVSTDSYRAYCPTTMDIFYDKVKTWFRNYFDFI